MSSEKDRLADEHLCEINDSTVLGPDLLPEVMARQPAPDRAPIPSPVQTVLPFASMDPLVFERLVAEVAQSVFRLDEVHAYGRSGQYQAGLDIVGWKGGEQIVYQVRRIDELTADALEVAVREFAKPTKRVKGKIVEVARPFPSVDEFVLVTGCLNDDTQLTDRLNALKIEFKDDFQPRLIDAARLTRTLRHYGAIVAGYFGPHWARELCHYPSNTNRPGIGDGRGLLDDPLAVIAQRGAYAHAQAIEKQEPAAAAAIYLEIGGMLAERSLSFADVIGWQATGAYEAAGDLEKAFHRSLSTAISDLESCQQASIVRRVRTPRKDAR